MADEVRGSSGVGKTNSAAALARMMAKYGIPADSPSGRGLLAYLGLLERWNLRINLTGSTAWPALGWLFEEALWAARMYPEGEVRHLDIGSGAGFPSLLLRILCPGMRLRLVESRIKKVTFLEKAAAEIRLDRVEVICGRIEDYLQNRDAGRADIVSWKGIRLSHEAVALLAARADAATQFWMFHGPELPLDDPVRSGRLFRLVRSERFSGAADKNLSIFVVSRETSCT
jgi:16S rRNA (guanine(527)-N(7))-methyltransferase RsmG